MDGRDKRGHDTWGTSVNLFAWYQMIKSRGIPGGAFP